MAASSTYQESNPLECKICCNVFSEDHCPRILPCSHSFCGPCIDRLISTQKKTCPLCRKEWTANSAVDFMINRDLFDAAEQLSSMLAASKTKSTRPKRPFLKTTEDFRESVTKRGIALCQGAEAEAKDLLDSYREMKKGVEGVHYSSEKLLISIDRNIKLLLNRLEKLQKNKTKFNESDAQLEAAADFISAAPLMQEAEELLQAVEGTMTKFQEDKRGERHIQKEILKMKDILEKFVKDAERTTGEGEPEPEEERGSVVKITVTDLRSPQGRLRGDAQRRVFATMSCEGTLRVAPVKMESNNQASLTHLQEGVLPPRCFVIELESLMQWSPSPSPSPSPPPSSPPQAFLDLVYESTPLGRVIIRVTENGLKGLNFLHMCAGGMGPSYAHSHVSRVGYKGRAGECVAFGAYVPHGGGGGGTSTRAVLSSREEDWERERKSGSHKVTSWKAGEVRGNISYEGASKFGIVTRDHPRWVFGHCFGMVKEGLDVLRTTILKYPDPDIKRVRVGECGLIL